MIQELHIRNYALFENVHIELGPHFNVFSGETGAGKSLLVGAIGLLLGNRGDSVVVRKGCPETEILGRLTIASENREALDWLESYKIPLEREEPAEAAELTVRRILKDNGKSYCYIQHIPLARNRLTEFMSLLFDLHSQHQNQSLFYSRQQLQMLDQHARLSGKVAQFSEAFRDFDQKKKDLAEAEAAAAQQQEQAVYLRRAIEEIAELKPQEDEDIHLSEQIELLSNAHSIREELEQLESEGRRALELLESSQSRLEALAQKLGAVEEYLPRLQSASIEIEDILDSCREEKNKLQVNPPQLQELDQRLSQLIGLSRKYGNSSLNEAIRFGQEAAGKLASLENIEDTIAKQKQDIQVLEAHLMQQARYLSQQRKKHATRLQQRIEENLHNLGMSQARFQIELSHRNNESGQVLCHNYGIDQARFLLAANPGENPHEVRQVASGGEISRIMLAIKSESGDAGSIETIIFDEIDSGIGGETGIRLAQHIHQLGQRRQILCVTHLAPIAASANTHIKIEKLSEADSTSVNIYQLSAEARAAELARMLSGDAENSASLAHAAELLSQYS